MIVGTWKISIKTPFAWEISLSDLWERKMSVANVLHGNWGSVNQIEGTFEGEIF